ncbi:MAG: toll/interleukin-1 receptor domain-containing protein [Hyphomonadaceae bacterium]|nr:toll/interleukin-1 receptor domain-containing protein [Hyphomonadaceae bacterium]
MTATVGVFAGAQGGVRATQPWGATDEFSGKAMSQAFISYHRAQRKLARLIAHRIAADGHSVWWDRGERPGDAWSEAVSTALANSACVVVIWSKQAAASPWVLGEATAGYGRGALVSVCADRTQPPSPFHKGPVIDMQDWEGAGDEVAWIRLREPVRARLDAAEKAAVEGAPLPPMPPGTRPPPMTRVGFSSADAPPPPPAYAEKRGGGAGAVMTLLLLGGAAAAGWTYRDPINEQLLAWREGLSPERNLAEIPPQPPAFETPPAPLSAAAPAAVESLSEAAATGEDAAPEEAPAPPAPPPRPAVPPAPAMTYSYEAWRDSYRPPPVLRAAPPPPPRFAA